MGQVSLRGIHKSFGAVDVIQGVDLEIEDGAFHLRERAPGVSVEEIVSRTAGRLVVPAEVPEMRFS